jgi:hypothetical protein
LLGCVVANFVLTQSRRIMLTCGRFFGLAAVLAAVAVFFLGLADRPPFVATTSPDVVAIVALSDDKDVGGNIMRLLQGTIKGIRATSNDGSTTTTTNHSHKRALMGAASRYGSPMGAEYLSVGLFLDDPKTVANPRWAIGYAVDVPYDQAQAMAAEIGAVDGTNVVRAVRISLASTLSARIPWRNIFTPMIGPRLHWPRGVELFRSEGHAATCGRHQEGGCTIALEAYVTGPKGSKEWIDYTIVMGDTTQTYDDLYPEPATEQEAQPPVPPEVPDAEPESEREAQETVGDTDTAEPEVETPEDLQETGEAADAAPEVEPQQEEEPEGTGEVHAELHHEQVPPIEPEVAAEAAIHVETHSEPEIVAEDPEPEVPPHEESHTPEHGEEAVEDPPGSDSAAHHHESDGDALGDAPFEGEEDSEHDAEESEEEFVEEEEQEEGEDGVGDEANANEEDGQEDEEVAGEDEEEYLDEEGAGEEYSDNDEEDEVEHFEDEEGHDEF